MLLIEYPVLFILNKQDITFSELMRAANYILFQSSLMYTEDRMDIYDSSKDQISLYVSETRSVRFKE